MSKSEYKARLGALVDELISDGAEITVVLNALTELTLNLMKDARELNRRA